MVSLSEIFIAERDIYNIGKNIEWGNKHCYFHPTSQASVLMHMYTG